MQISKDTIRKFPVPDDPQKGWVKIKHLELEEIEAISLEVTNQTITYDKNGKNPKMIQDQNLANIQNALIKAAVDSWGNFKDESGKALKLNDENLNLFIRKGKGFKNFILECRKKLADEIKEEKKEQEKNL